MEDFNVNDAEIHVVVNRDAIVERKIEFVDEVDENKVLIIEKGEKIKVLGQNYEHYCFICEYKGTKFHCTDVISDKKLWKNSGDPNTDILVTYI